MIRLHLRLVIAAIESELDRQLHLDDKHIIERLFEPGVSEKSGTLTAPLKILWL